MQHHARIQIRRCRVVAVAQAREHRIDLHDVHPLGPLEQGRFHIDPPAAAQDQDAIRVLDELIRQSTFGELIADAALLPAGGGVSLDIQRSMHLIEVLIDSDVVKGRVLHRPQVGRRFAGGTLGQCGLAGDGIDQDEVFAHRDEVIGRPVAALSGEHNGAQRDAIEHRARQAPLAGAQHQPQHRHQGQAHQR